MAKEEKIILSDGMIAKSAEIRPQEVTEEDLKKINQYTLEPLTAEDVFVFKTVVGDNETDDRNFEPFNLKALEDMAKLYPGRTLIKDHDRSADNQIARVYDTEVVTDSERITKAGEPYARIIAKNYMLRTESNADLIKEIQGGIKKEVSCGVRPEKLVCSICGADNMKTFCPHWPGESYERSESGHKETCLMTINGVKEAYELSLVAVPAQPRAGVVKHCGADPEVEEKTAPPEPEEVTQEETKNHEQEDLINARIRADESFLFINSHIMKGDS